MLIVGADFLNNFGVWVDIKNKRIIDGNTGLRTSGKLLKDCTSSCTISTIRHLNLDPAIRDLPVIYNSMSQSSVEITDVKHVFKARRLSAEKLDAAECESGFNRRLTAVRGLQTLEFPHSASRLPYTAHRGYFSKFTLHDCFTIHNENFRFI